MTYVLAQLSDPHIGATWTDDADPLARFQRCLAAAAELRPDALIVTGDLAEHGAGDEYAQVRDALVATGIPFQVLAGNHDDRAQLRSAFGLDGDGPIQYAADLGAIGVVALDTTIPGADDGELDEALVAAALAAAPAKPLVVAFHHPPVDTGVPVLDDLALPGRHGDALLRALAGDERVALLTAGHLHRPIQARLGPHPLFVAPSTYLQTRVGFDLTELELSDEPPAFAMHVIDGSAVVSHVIAV